MTLFDEKKVETLSAGTAEPAPAARSGSAKAPLTEAEGKRLKRLLFWWSLPFVLAAGAVGLKLLSMPVLAQASIASYEAGDYTASETSAQHLLFANIIDPYRAYFDRGTAASVGKNWVVGTDDLSKALELAPDKETECMVRVNLARSYETQGDEYVKGKFYQGAMNLYDTAKRIVDDGGSCFKDQPPKSQPNQPNPSASSDPSPGGTPPPSGQASPPPPPSKKPSPKPSQQPSQNPSQQPSQNPSQQPSDQPSQQPSDQPSQQPGDQPQQPGGQPSQQPDQNQDQVAPDQIDPKQTPGENLKDTGDRVDKKRKGAADKNKSAGDDKDKDAGKKPGDADKPDQGGSSGTGDPDLDNKVDDLIDAGKDAEKDKASQDSSNRGDKHDDGNYAERPW